MERDLQMNTQVCMSDCMINIRHNSVVYCLVTSNVILWADEADSTPVSCNLRARIQRREEDSAVRRSSRITRYKLNARNQSVLYDRLITKYE